MDNKLLRRLLKIGIGVGAGILLFVLIAMFFAFSPDQEMLYSLTSVVDIVLTGLMLIFVVAVGYWAYTQFGDGRKSHDKAKRESELV